ncbi:hypothetical protein ABT158_07240 [Nonomuraea sp. NPDC001636]|uniref:hypothetical protein n=1 Tax=Nonomuraea sp. NPDC001636 TaxID=3154391 RepID=UPI00332C711F
MNCTIKPTIFLYHPAWWNSDNPKFPLWAKAEIERVPTGRDLLVPTVRCDSRPMGPYKETNPVVYHGACISKYDDFGVQVKKEVPGNYDAPLRLADGRPNPASRPLTRITDDDVAADAFNASVRPMTTSHNSTAGRDLWLFYARYRVHRTSKFWVSVKDQPPR